MTMALESSPDGRDLGVVADRKLDTARSRWPDQGVLQEPSCSSQPAQPTNPQPATHARGRQSGEPEGGGGGEGRNGRAGREQSPTHAAAAPGPACICSSRRSRPRRGRRIWGSPSASPSSSSRTRARSAPRTAPVCR